MPIVDFKTQLLISSHVFCTDGDETPIMHTSIGTPHISTDEINR